MPQTIHLYFSSTTAIASVETDDLLTVSPNPFTDNLLIFNPNKTTFIKIFDALGRVIFSSEIPSGKYYLETKYWLPGIYYLTNGAMVQKLVKS